jgi:hypothetical protein
VSCGRYITHCYGAEGGACLDCGHDPNAGRPEPLDLVENKLAEIRRQLASLRAQEEVLCAIRTDCERKSILAASGTSGSAQDRNGLDPKGAGPTAEGGDAQPSSPEPHGLQHD